MTKGHYLLLFLALLLLILWQFPYANLKDGLFKKIYEKTQVRMEAEDMNLSLLGWPGFRLSHCEVEVPLGTQVVTLNSDNLLLKLVPGKWFRPSLAVSLWMGPLKKGGTLKAKVALWGDPRRISLSAYDLSPALFLPPPFDQSVQAALRLSGWADLGLGNAGDTRGKFQVEADTVRIGAQTISGFAIPPLWLGKFSAQGFASEGVLRLAPSVLGDKTSDLRGILEGQMQIGQQWAQSQLHLLLRFSLSPEFEKKLPGIRSLLEGFREVKKTSYEYACEWDLRLLEAMQNPILWIPHRVSQARGE